MTVDLLPGEVKGCVFDCDGTLLNSMTLHWQAWKLTTLHFGLELSLQNFLALAGTPATDILSILCSEQGLQADRDAALTYKSETYDKLVSQVLPIKPVLEIFEAAKARGLPIAVASGGSRSHVTAGLKATGLLDKLDAVVTCEDVQRGKPEPDIFLLAVSRLGVSPSLCVGYEDADLGLQAIKSAGFLQAIDVRLLAGYPHVSEDESNMERTDGTV